MSKNTHIMPGMTINMNGKIYRVESCVKVALAKGTPFIKTKLRDLITDKVSEKNFKLDQVVKEAALVEHQLEYLYPEGKDYLFLDAGNLEQVLVSGKILGDAVHFLKEGIQVKALFYGDTVFSVELPQFLELMIVKTEGENDKMRMSNAMKTAVLETGAVIKVPLFIEAGDIIKIDVVGKEYIQRV